TATQPIEDGRCGGGEEQQALGWPPLVTEAWVVPVHDLGEEHEPVTIMAATDEGPLPAQPVAAVYRDRLPTGRERARNDGLRRTVNDLRRALVRQPCQKAAGGNREL